MSTSVVSAARQDAFPHVVPSPEFLIPVWVPLFSDFEKYIPRRHRRASLKTVTMLLAASLVSVSEPGFSQQDSIAMSYFPSAIGNVWEYQSGPTGSLSWSTLDRDSIAGGNRYLFFDGGTRPRFAIDSTGLWVTSNPLSAKAWRKYKLDAKEGESWTVLGGGSEGRIAGRVDSEYWGIVVGHITRVKQIRYYTQGGDTTDFTFWLYEEHLAAGFGFYWMIGDAVREPSGILVGCIIDGVRYGTLVAVAEQAEPAAVSGCALQPAYPNPFNAATNLSYALPAQRHTRLVVFDVLGREVACLCEGLQGRGTYTVRFVSENLPSGLYFVRLTAGTFTQTQRIVYAR